MVEAHEIDPAWWTSGVIDGEPTGDVLARHDITKIFRFMNSRGWSQNRLARASGLSEGAVRMILQGRRKVESYGVLVRIAEGLSIPRDAMGLGQAGAAPR